MTDADTIDREDETEQHEAQDAQQKAARGPIPTNSPIGIAHRFTRNPNPITPPPLMGGHMPPAKMRPGSLPYPTQGEVDPTVSPTPGHDGETHVPLGQRSQAIPTMGRTLPRRAMGDGYGQQPISHVEAEQREHDNAHEGPQRDDEDGEDTSDTHTSEDRQDAPGAASEGTGAPATSTARGRRAAQTNA